MSLPTANKPYMVTYCRGFKLFPAAFWNISKTQLKFLLENALPRLVQTSFNFHARLCNVLML